VTTIPRPALILGLAGLLPFLWGVATVLSPGLADLGRGIVGQRLVEVPSLIAYGTVILCFMSGVLWGFAAKGAEHQWRGYGLSVLPALWVFFMVGGGPGQALSALLVGFLVLLVLDMQFAGWGLVPRWWMRLRLMLTAGVVACLAVGMVAG
jgi:hypothetical protein